MTHNQPRWVSGMPNQITPIPAIVVGGGENCGGLGVVRSLSRDKIPIWIVDRDASAPGLHSRYATKLISSEMTGLSLVKDLLLLRARLHDRPVLFLTSDEAVLTVSEYRKELEDSFRFRLPSHQRLCALMHKIEFQQLAELHGFPVPRSIRVRSKNDLSRLSDLGFPCVVKPAIKTAKYRASGLRPAYKVFTTAEAEAVCGQLLPILPDLVVQEWIEGPDDELYFCLTYHTSEGPLCSFTGRKLSIWPPNVGPTASCTVAPDAHATLAPVTTAFFQAVSFEGLGSIEVKRDTRTGQFLMIEPTVGRVDWQEEVATLHGINIPLSVYRYEAEGQVPCASQVSRPIIWRDFARHRNATHRARGHQSIKTGAKIYDAYWRLNDPLPALFYVSRLFMRILHNVLRSAISRRAASK